MGAKKYKWEDGAMEKFIKQNTKNIKATYYPKGELVISKDYLNGSNVFKLSWKFTISSLAPNNEQWIFVDAITGNIIQKVPLILDVNVPCVAQTRYSGNRNITGDTYTGGIRLRETRNGVTIQTLNMNSAANYANATEFANNNTNWTNGSWTNITPDRPALDAHWAAETILDFWQTIFNRNSIDGAGLTITGYVHYFDASSTAWPNNAQWDGANNVMRYGDGDGSILNPLTALDVCSHELGHGINQFTASLTPGNTESGALNEGFSDIWSACIENWAAPTKQTWLMGEEVVNSAIFSCIRDLQNPKTTTAAEGQHPDTYQGEFWRADGEPHNNSTVLSHWFFLLSQGGSGTNDIFNTFSVGAIGINDAQRIAYRAESVYLNSSANYVAARNATIQAAIDLFGSGSCQEISVTNAWFAVGVGNPFISNLTISGDNVVCGTSNAYSISGLPIGANVTWSASPSNIVSLIPNGNQVTVSKLADGTITLTATINNACGGANITIAKENIVVGTQTPSDIVGLVPPLAVSQNQLLEYEAGDALVGSYNWSVQGGTIQGPNDRYNVAIIADNCPQGLSNGYLNVSLTYTNACGTGNTYSEWTTIDCSTNGGEMFRVSPNPSNGDAEVKSKNPKFKIKEIRITDKLGTIKKTIKFNDGIESTKINVSSLAPDTYILQVFDGKKWHTQKLMKN